MEADRPSTIRPNQPVLLLMALALAVVGPPPREGAPLLARAPAPPSVAAPVLRQTLRWSASRSITVAFSPGGKTVALGEERTGLIQVRRLPDGKLLETIKTPGISGRVPSCLTVSPDGKTLAVIDPGGAVRLCPLGGRASLDLGKVAYIEISPVAFHPNGQRLAVFARGYRARLWDVATGAGTGMEIVVGENADALAFSPDGRWLATGHYHGRPTHQVVLWEVATGKKVRRLGFFDARTSALAFSPDGKRLGAADQNGNLKLFDVGSGRLLHDLKGHTDYVCALAFSPNGKTLASGARQKGDSTLRLWEVASGRQRAVLKAPGGTWALMFRGNGRLLYSASGSGAVHLWDLPAGW